MDVRFDCTQCGKCCHDLKLPLSVDEAIAWAGQGHTVRLLIDARPDDGFPPTDVAEALYRYERSFPGVSASVAIRVNVMLVAFHDGPCPHLTPEMLCGNYEARPRVCRIYPAEAVPGIPLMPERKLCPPEAWAPDQPLFEHAGHVVSDETRRLIDAQRAVMLDDIPTKAWASALMGIDTAAFGNEGLAIHSPEPGQLAAALIAARGRQDEALPPRDWTLLTNRGGTLKLLEDAGARAQITHAGDGFISFFEDDD